jgi:uncharacterized protein (TIGR03083 family)
VSGIPDTVLSVERYVSQIRRDIVHLADHALTAGLDAPVPTCPDWVVRDLLSHLGGVHRWATTIVGGALNGNSREMFGLPGARGSAPGDDALVDWVTAGASALATTLEAAQADLACWTFFGDLPPVVFWARRQAHETAIHTLDAVHATGGELGYDTDIAADGIDELVGGFSSRFAKKLFSEPERTILIAPDNVVDRWFLRFSPDTIAVEPYEGQPEQCSLTGSVQDIYRALWNRGDYEMVVHGDADVFAWRRAAMAVK